MKGVKLLIIFSVLILSIQLASAECTIKVNSKFTSELMNELSSINNQIQKCPIELPSLAKKLKDANLIIDIKEEIGVEKKFLAETKSGKITKVSKTIPADYLSNYIITINEADLDAILQSEDALGTFSYIYRNGKIKITANKFWSKIKFFFVKPFIKIGLKSFQKPILSNQPQQSKDIGSYPGYRVCEFYQINKKHVTCAAYKAADTFCVLVMQHKDARAVSCEEKGMIVCKLPCKTQQTYIVPTRCAFDNERPRGNQAPPLDFCIPETEKPQPAKKSAGQICQHGGECNSGNCVGVGQGPPWTYECSCDPFRFVPGNC